MPWIRPCLMVLVMVLAGCASVDDRRGNARDLAATADLAPLVFSAAPFQLAGWMRVQASGQPLVVYVEGDGLAWLDRGTLSPDPTPRNPLALELAVLDRAPNVLYLARPCQYVGNSPKMGCPADGRYWSINRFAPEVIDAVNTAIDQAKARAKASSVHLVGFSGGGAVVVLAADRRSDVASLRTVAGNLDHVALNRYHKVDQLRGSLDPLEAAPRVSKIPQIHYVGQDDPVVLPFVSAGYLQAAGHPACVTRQIIPKASHLQGWTDVWPRLALQFPRCEGTPSP